MATPLDHQCEKHFIALHKKLLNKTVLDVCIRNIHLLEKDSMNIFKNCQNFSVYTDFVL